MGHGVGYLLGTRALVAFIHDREVVTKRLMTSVGEGAQLFISVISLGQISSEVKRLQNVADRTSWEQHLRRIRNKFEGSGNTLHIDILTVDIWAEIRGEDLQIEEDGILVNLGEDDRLVLATAISQQLTLVEPRGPYVDVLQRTHLLRHLAPIARI